MRLSGALFGAASPAPLRSPPYAPPLQTGRLPRNPAINAADDGVFDIEDLRMLAAPPGPMDVWAGGAAAAAAAAAEAPVDGEPGGCPYYSSQLLAAHADIVVSARSKVASRFASAHAAGVAVALAVAVAGRCRRPEAPP